MTCRRILPDGVMGALAMPVEMTQPAETPLHAALDDIPNSPALRR